MTHVSQILCTGHGLHHSGAFMDFRSLLEYTEMKSISSTFLQLIPPKTFHIPAW